MRIDILILFIFSIPAYADTSLSEFLLSAWKQSPVIAGESLKNEESEQFVSSARGKYYPHVSLAAIDSTGFPSSSGLLQVGGLMGSAFRSGAAGGIILEQTIYDFGRIRSTLEAVKADKSVNEAKLADEKHKFLSSVGQLYLNCARTKSLIEENERMMVWARLILQETTRFTNTGQRSIIDNSLVKSKMNALDLQHTELKKLKNSLVEQMRLYSNISDCGTLKASQQTLPSELTIEDPSLLLAKAQVEISRAGVESAKAAQLPTLKAIGSAGYMERARLVERQEYSAGIGLVFPIWNGGEDQHREQAFKSQVEYRSQALKVARLEFDAKMKNLRDQKARTRESLSLLEQNLEHVRSTMQLASKRYERLEGPLIDVRDAYSELQTVEYHRVNLLYSLAQSSLELGLLKSE